MDGDGWVTGDVGGAAGDDELTLSVCSRILSGAEMTEMGGVIGWIVSLGRFSARWAPESWDTRQCADREE